jgi:F0F1-type ATP synthase epsilon subunit
MQLKVITSDRGVQIDKEASLVEAEGLEGEFGILEDHIAFITPLKAKSFIRYQTTDNSPINKIDVLGGVLEVSKKKGKTEVIVIASKISQ